MNAQNFAVGTVFLPRGKHSKPCTVIDKWVTLNLAREIVKVRYVATHEFCGQTVTDYDVPCATIARGMISEPKQEGTA